MSNLYRAHLRDLLTRHTGDWLRKQSQPRLIALIVMLVASAAYVAAFWFLPSLGVQRLSLSAIVCGITSYLAYLVSLGCWLFMRNPVNSKLFKDLNKSLETKIPGDTHVDRMLDEQVEKSWEQAQTEANSEVEFLILTGVFGIVFVLIHFIYHAAWYLGQLMVDSGNVRHRLTADKSILLSIIAPSKQSLPIFVVLLIQTTLIGLILDTMK